MNRYCIAALAVVGLFLLGGCDKPSPKPVDQPSLEALSEDLLGVFTSMGDTLERVTDENSAIAAAPTLTALHEQEIDLLAQIKARPAPTASEQAMIKSYTPRFQEAGRKVGFQSVRIQHSPKLLAPLKEILPKLL